MSIFFSNYHSTSPTSAKTVRIDDEAKEAAGLSPYVLTKHERATLDPNYKKPRRKVRSLNQSRLQSSLAYQLSQYPSYIFDILFHYRVCQ